MTRDEAKTLLPIIQAFAEGKAIQYRISLVDGEKWQNASVGNTSLSFSAPGMEYRIKPEPVVRWGIEHADGTFWSTAETQADAEAIAGPGLRIFKMVEVAE